MGRQTCLQTLLKTQCFLYKENSSASFLLCLPETGTYSSIHGTKQFMSDPCKAIPSMVTVCNPCTWEVKEVAEFTAILCSEITLDCISKERKEEESKKGK